MRESLLALFGELGEAGELAHAQAAAEDWNASREQLRRVLSAASKLHARLALLGELAIEAGWMAEVDRAVRRANPESVLPIPGDTPLPFLTEDPPPAPKKRGNPRKPR